MNIKLLTDQHLELLSSKGGCADLSESTLVKMPHCWKSRVTAHMCFFQTGEGTPGITGWLEVTVGGKLVHSKKVCS